MALLANDLFQKCLLSLLGALVGFLLGRLSERLSKREARYETLVRAFAPALSALRQPRPDDRAILQDHFDAHWTAYNEHRLFLSMRRRRRLDKAWQRYERHCRQRVEVSVAELIATEILDPARARDPAHHEEVRVFRAGQATALILALLAKAH